MIDRKDYSLDDLKLYYGNSFVYNGETDEVMQVQGFDWVDEEIHAYLLNNEGVVYHFDLDDLRDNPVVNQLRNNEYGAYYIHKFSNKQFRIGCTPENTKVIPVIAGGTDLLGYVTSYENFSDSLRPFFNEEKYPSIKEAEKQVKEGYKLSCAFSPHFALAIPLIGEELIVTKHEFPIGILANDGKVMLSEYTLPFKEELEQYAEVSEDVV